jgi:hypothetical protein
MKFKGTAGMIAVLLGLAVYYFFVDLPTEKKKAQEKEIAGKVLYFKIADIEEFSLIKNEATITLQQTKNSTWRISKPLKAAGDNPETESFLSEIENLKKFRVVEKNPKDLTQYGLQNPTFKIHLKFKEGKEKTLLLGHDSPMGGKIYLKFKNEPKVLLATTSKTRFDKSVYDLRDKTIFNFSSGAINQIQIKREKNPFNLTQEKGEWLVSGEMKSKADKDEVLAFIQAIQFSRIKEFESENPDSLKPYGLDKPITTLTLKTEKKNKYSIALGNPKIGSGTFAKKEDAPGVFLVDTKFYDNLNKKNIDFLDKTLIEFEEKNVAEITLQTGEETIQAVRLKKDDWEIKKPKETRADSATIRSLLFDLKEAKIDKFVQLSSLNSYDSFGLDKAQHTFSLTMINGKLIKISFGNSSLEEEKVFAQRNGETTVFLLSKKTTQKLFRSFHELRDKKLFKFKTDDVNKIVIETQKNHFELLKSGNNWSLIKPDEMEIKEFLAKDLLWTMNGMEFESFAETDIVPESAGLTTPTYKISVWKNSTDKIAELQVGNIMTNGQQYFAQIEGKNGYYQIKKKHLAPIPLNLNRFKVQ